MRLSLEEGDRTFTSMLELTHESQTEIERRVRPLTPRMHCATSRTSPFAPRIARARTSPFGSWGSATHPAAHPPVSAARWPHSTPPLPTSDAQSKLIVELEADLAESQANSQQLNTTLQQERAQHAATLAQRQAEFKDRIHFLAGDSDLKESLVPEWPVASSNQRAASSE